MAQVAHLKGPEKDGKRDPVYFASHVDFVDGLNEKLENEINATSTKAGTVKLYGSTGSNTDGAMTQLAVSNALNSKVPCPTPTAFTIAANAWQENSSETSEFVYYADITVSGLTVNDYAEVNFNRTSQNIIATANICPSGDTMSGKIRIYAKNIPTDSISGQYIITKGMA